MTIYHFYSLDFNTGVDIHIANEIHRLLSKNNIRSNSSQDYINILTKQDDSGLTLHEAIIQVWHKILDEPHPLLCKLIIDEVNKSFQMSAQSKDIERILKDYNDAFKKIRAIKNYNKKSMLGGDKD